MTNTRISELPSSLSELDNLNMLILSHNAIVGIPEVIFRIKYLRVLRLSASITSIPDDIASLNNLVELSLVNNHLKELPLSLSMLRMLDIIDLSQNEFTGFPDVITKMVNLGTIRISGNQLHSVPDLAALSNLRGIDLSDNPISKISGLSHLKYINLMHTLVTQSTVDELLNSGVSVHY